jgi:hypothetical protein
VELLLLQAVELGQLRLILRGQILLPRKQSQAEPRRHLADLTATSTFNTSNLWQTT